MVKARYDVYDIFSALLETGEILSDGELIVVALEANVPHEEIAGFFYTEEVDPQDLHLEMFDNHVSTRDVVKILTLLFEKLDIKESVNRLA